MGPKTAGLPGSPLQNAISLRRESSPTTLRPQPFCNPRVMLDSPACAVVCFQGLWKWGFWHEENQAVFRIPRRPTHRRLDGGMPRQQHDRYADGYGDPELGRWGIDALLGRA